VALSEKARNNNIIVVDNIELNAPKTKEAAGILNSFHKKFGNLGSVLILTPLLNKSLYIAVKNIQRTGITEARNLNSLEALSYKNLIIFKDAVNVISNLNKSR
ncbi:MAG: 50S ribosomal protein L4, partial [Patescibacteria group bacterium]